MNRYAITLILVLSCSLLQGCIVTSVASAAIDITSAAVSTTASIGKAVVKTASKAI